MQLSEEVKALIDNLLLGAINEKLQMFSGLNKLAKPNQIVFVGDSITEGFPIDELLVSQKQIYKRGISGIEAIRVVKEYDRVLKGLCPSEVFILLGTNDIGKGRSIAETVTAIMDLCEALALETPNVKRHLLSLYPVIENANDMVGIRKNKTIVRINQKLEAYSKTSESLYYHDIYSLLLDKESGQLQTDFTQDGLHLTLKGYQKVCDYLQSYLL